MNNNYNLGEMVLQLLSDSNQTSPLYIINGAWAGHVAILIPYYLNKHWFIHTWFGCFRDRFFSFSIIDDIAFLFFLFLFCLLFFTQFADSHDQGKVALIQHRIYAELKQKSKNYVFLCCGTFMYKICGYEQIQRNWWLRAMF